MDNPAAGSTVRLKRRVQSQPVPDGLVLLDLDSLAVLELDAPGAAMWEALAAAPEPATAMEHAISVLLARYDVDRPTLEADLGRFVEELVEAGLASPADEPAASEPTAGMTPLPAPSGPSPGDLYLDLLTRAIAGLTVPANLPRLDTRVLGRDGPCGDPVPMSMIGLVRLRNIRDLAERVLADGVAGDFIECGVWRGGAAMVMRGVLAAHGVSDRKVWLADSFAGLPTPDPERYPEDAFWQPWAGRLAVSEQQVRRNFEAYGLLDDQVRFLPGWFADTLPQAPPGPLALLRLDGDLYASTEVALRQLYPRLSPGGFVIIDDYYLTSCRQAVDDYRAAEAIEAELQPIDWTGVWWRKSAP